MKLPVLKMAFRNVWVHRRSNSAALTSIAAAFLALALFRGYIDGVLKLFNDNVAPKRMLGQVIIEKEGAGDEQAGSAHLYLSKKEQEWIENYLKAQNTLKFSRFLNVSGMITNGSASLLFVGYGYDIEPGIALRGIWGWDTLAGRPLETTDENSVVLGRHLAALLDCVPTSQEPYFNGYHGYIPKIRPFECKTKDLRLSSTTMNGRSNAIDVDIVGIADGSFIDYDSKLVMMPLRQAQLLMDTNFVDRYSVEVNPTKNLDQFISDLKRDSEMAGFKFSALKWQDHRYGSTTVSTMKWFDQVKFFIILVLVGVVGLSVVSTVQRIIDERTGEVGTLRSLGFQRKHVTRLIILESAVIAMIGNVLGLLSCLIAMYALNNSGIRYQTGMLSEPIRLRIVIDSDIVITTAFLLCVLCIAAAALPAWRLSKRKIIECMGQNI